jgi:hypothetical protein
MIVGESGTPGTLMEKYKLKTIVEALRKVIKRKTIPKKKYTVLINISGRFFMCFSN